MSEARAPDPHHAGIGLRAPHYRELAQRRPPVSFLEVHSENFFGEGGAALATLESFRETYPISLHGVGMSLGSIDPLDEVHVGKLAALVRRIEPSFVSEHLCWSSVGGVHANDLLPLPYNEEALAHVASRVQQLQERLGRQILVENVSSYLEFESTTIAEAEFVSEVARRAGCGVLLDVNNIWVNAVNHGLDPHAYLEAIAPEAVGEIHLAGFEDTGSLLIDTHGAPVSDDVWSLYERAVARFGPRPTLIEWDTDIPALDVLLGEAGRADAILARRDRPRRTGTAN